MAPKIVDREEKRARIVEAALRVFSEQGYQNARMADIAREAGIGKGTVYEYFRSKEELVEAIFTSLLGEFGGRIEAMSHAQGPVLDSILLIARESLEQAREFAPFVPVYFQIMGVRLSNREDATKQPGAGFDRAGKALAKLIRRGIKTGEIASDVDAEAVGRMLISALDGMALHIGLFDPEPREIARQGRAFEAMLKAALRPQSKQGGKK